MKRFFVVAVCFLLWNRAFSIADQTPYEGGDGVYIARVMIDYDPDNHEVAYRFAESQSAGTSEKKIIIYPNPAIDLLYIEFYNEDLAEMTMQIQLFTLSGSLVYEKELKTYGIFEQINIEDLNNGFYFYKIQLSNGIQESGKLVILK